MIVHTLIDTNIIIYYFNGMVNDDSIHKLLEESFNISVITKIEFLGWSKFAEDAELHEKAQSFISNSTVYPLDDTIIAKTILLRQRYKIKTPDAIIAATALVHGLKVATNNASDFKRSGVDLTSVKLRP